MVDPVAAILRDRCEPLPAIDDEAFAAAFDRFGEAKVVLLGEATHGTSEFYRARAAITRRLIERHGFRIVALEADWPDASALDRFVRARDGAARDGAPFRRFPQWMWRNVEVADFAAALRDWNARRPQDDRVEVRGLDLYSLNQSVEAVLNYLGETDPELAAEARERYRCITPYLNRPELYGAEATRGGESCERAVIEQLVELLRREAELASADGQDWFDATQNARVVRAAETYYRALYRGSIESWNLRDRHMYETLRQVLGARDPGAKAVVWAHNSHVGDASETELGWAGEWNIGQLTREAFGDAARLIGFGTDTGEVAAAEDWGEPMEVMTVRPARDDSWEGAFRDHAPPASLLDLRNGAREALGDTERLERAIGVIYRPRTERRSHYFGARLARQFDAFVWFARTSPVTPLPSSGDEPGAETWPFGV